MTTRKTVFFLAVALLVLGAAYLLAQQAANADKPGQELDIKSYLQKGVTNVIDFYSEYCPPCRKISPLLEKLDQKRSDIVVIKLDINRPGIKGIDWRSPLAQQFGLQSIPHFKIYDAEGNLKSEGDDAYQEVMDLLQEEGPRP